MDVYFIQQGDDGPVKIGVSGSARGRLIDLQRSHAEKLTLLGRRTLPEGWAARELEAELHHRLRRHRIRGEWFKPSRTVLKVVREVSDPVPPRREFAAIPAPVELSEDERFERLASTMRHLIDGDAA